MPRAARCGQEQSFGGGAQSRFCALRFSESVIRNSGLKIVAAAGHHLGSRQEFLMVMLSMDTEYLSYLKEDAKLYSVVKDKLPELQLLSSAQVEKLVFYLKSLHSYYPKSENHVAFHSGFSDKLEGLRNSAEQVALQRRAGAAVLKGIACCVFAGALLAAAVAALLGGQIAVGVGFLVAVGAIILFADSRPLRKALLLSKEQDRKYFLSSIRTANACNELDWAGLFSYNQASKTGPQSDADLARLEAEVGDLTSRLRAALYNDEHFQYSPIELKATKPSEG